MKSVFREYLDEHLELFRNLSGLDIFVEQAVLAICDAFSAGGKLLLCGNGGSAADCQHIAAELTGRFLKERRPLPAVSLATDTSALTCIGNDYSFSEIFSRQVQAIGNKNDCLLGISTSGNSENVITAVLAGKHLGMRTIGLLGRDGGKLAKICDLAIVVPSNTTARIQEAHLLIGHSICGHVEQKLGLVSE